jgi:ABC-2 type transport system permease protein
MVFIILTAAFFACLGVILCMSVTDPHSLMILTSLIIYPLSFLCGIFFPINYLPDGIQPIIELIPLARAVAGIRTIPFTIYNPGIWLDVGYIAILAIIFFVIGTYRYSLLR